MKKLKMYQTTTGWRIENNSPWNLGAVVLKMKPKEYVELLINSGAKVEIYERPNGQPWLGFRWGISDVEKAKKIIAKINRVLPN